MAKSKGDGKDNGEKRGLWNGAISFSLIHIPVSLHTASRATQLDLNLLDKHDFAPVGYQRYNKAADAAKKATSANSRELSMALKLIDEMSEPWKPSMFHDTYREDLMKRIDEKVKSGQTHALTQPEGEVVERATGGGKVVDLMTLLQRSLEQKGGGGASASANRGTKRKHSAARRRTATTRASRRA
jgi:DNA end-binding protein Ku